MDETGQNPTTTRLVIGKPIGRGIVIFAALVVIMAGLRASSVVVVPAFLAVFFAVLFTPILMRLRRLLPFAIALTLTLILLLAALILMPLIIGSSLQQLLSEMPAIYKQLVAFEHQMVSWAAGLGLEIPDDRMGDIIDPSWMVSLFTLFANGVMRVFNYGFIVFILTAFMLAEADWFAAKLSLIDGGTGEGRRKAQMIAASVRRYVSIRTFASAGTGLLIWLGLWILGVEDALSWGIIAFILNFVPTIGSIIAGVPPVLISLLEYGYGKALLVAAVFIGVNQLFGSVIEPRMQGRGLGLSPMVVFFSLLFWGWAFGPIGMLLSALITMIIKFVLEGFPETRWIAILLGGKPEAPPPAGKNTGETASPRG